MQGNKIQLMRRETAGVIDECAQAMIPEGSAGTSKDTACLSAGIVKSGNISRSNRKRKAEAAFRLFEPAAAAAVVVDEAANGTGDGVEDLLGDSAFGTDNDLRLDPGSDNKINRVNK
jgi:hypothetical protein